MPATILLSPSIPREYIEVYKKENNIASYNVKEFSAKLKIADARDIIKFFSTKLDASHARLVVISHEVTVDAQNALLKCIEELPLQAHILWWASSDDTLLPTIVSRCHVISLHSSERVQKEQKFEAILQELFSQFNNDNILYSALRVSEQVETLDDVESLLYELRSILVGTIKKGKTAHAIMLVRILEDLNNSFQFLKINNVNKRFTVERVLMENLLKNTS